MNEILLWKWKRRKLSSNLGSSLQSSLISTFCLAWILCYSSPIEGESSPEFHARFLWPLSAEMRKMAGFGIPASPPPPDLSNLTEEEKQIIQSVLQRQKQMEDETLKLQRWAFKNALFVCIYNAMLALGRIDRSLRV